MTDIDKLIEQLRFHQRECGESGALYPSNLCGEAAAALAELRDDRQKLLKTRFENVGGIDKMRERIDYLETQVALLSRIRMSQTHDQS